MRRKGEGKKWCVEIKGNMRVSSDRIDGWRVREDRERETWRQRKEGRKKRGKETGKDGGRNTQEQFQ